MTKGLFTVAEKEAIMKKPWKHALRGKQLQAEKWSRVYQKTMEAFREEGKMKHTAVLSSKLFDKVDRLETQLYHMKRMTVTGPMATLADFEIPEEKYENVHD